MTLRLLICGTRTFTNYALLCRECDAIEAHYSAVEMVSGGANGADLLGERWAHERGWPVRRFLPNPWRR